MSDDRLTFKEMCAKFDVTPRTLRYYEYIELLHPVREGRSRIYGRREMARMTLILRGRRFGFSLEDIRKWLLLYDEQGPKSQYAEFVKLADRQVEALTTERKALDETIDDLTALRDETLRNLKE